MEATYPARAPLAASGRMQRLMREAVGGGRRLEEHLALRARRSISTRVAEAGACARTESRGHQTAMRGLISTDAGHGGPQTACAASA